MARYLFVAMLFVVCIVSGCGGGGSDDGGGGGGGPIPTGSMVVLGYNDLGMHCMNEDFSQLMVLPPYNTLHAQIIDRSGEEPRIVTGGVNVTYSIPGNTHSTDKTNFWTYAKRLTGLSLAPNVGLTGKGLSGTMSPTGNNDWSVEGIPITPITDAGVENPYQLANILVGSATSPLAKTQAVVPVSWEMNCELCHNNSEAPANVLVAHDNLHGTSLATSTPVRCGKCHAQVPLGALGAGSPGRPSLSRAMHGAHSDRMDDVAGLLGGVECYACHPGQRTKCLRDVHFTKGMDCNDCHSTMTAVASETRRPWVDEPRCDGCHSRAGFSFEQAGTLFRNSKGHHGVHCAACHGSPHAITPTVVAADNVQAIALQGHAGTIDTCIVCHRTKPDDSFDHRFSGDD